MKYSMILASLFVASNVYASPSLSCIAISDDPRHAILNATIDLSSALETMDWEENLFSPPIPIPGSAFKGSVVPGKMPENFELSAIFRMTENGLSFSDLSVKDLSSGFEASSGSPIFSGRDEFPVNTHLSTTLLKEDSFRLSLNCGLID
jgi:hypothetical protein